MRRLALTLALLLPFAIDGVLLAEVIPEGLVVQKKEELGLDDINRLSKELDQAYTTGLYQKAINLAEQVLVITQKALGSEHPSTATSLDNLAMLYEAKGLYSKAEPLYIQALAIREKVLGPDHPDTAFSSNNLASLYVEQGLYSEAEPLYTRALAINEKVFGLEHPDTGMYLNNLARLYMWQGLYSKAEPLYTRALAIAEKVFGPEHRVTAVSLGNLAILYRQQGLYSKAESLYLRALAINEKVLGLEHPDTAVSLNNLAKFYDIQGLNIKAEPLYKRTLAIAEKVLGPEHPDMTTARNNLALLYMKQGLHIKAEPLFKRGLKTHFIFIQREAPYLPIAERQSFLDLHPSSFYFSSTVALKTKTGLRLALFSRLNRQGLLEEIERRQSQLANLSGPQQVIARELRQVTQQISLKDLKQEQRKRLSKRQKELERKLYRLLPELRPRIVSVDQVAKKIPHGAVLLEYQRYQSLDAKKSDHEKFGESRYLSFILKPNGELDTIDLGLAEPIEKKIQQASRSSEEGLGDAQQLWNEVGDLVVKPLREVMGDAEILFISPDAELNRIPFAALSSHKGDDLLGEAVNIRLLTTGRELLYLAKASKATKQKPLVIANPAFDLIKTYSPEKTSDLIAGNTSQQRSGDLASFNWSPLPGTAKEGKEIAQLTKAQLLTKNKATALAIQEQDAPKVLHIASHAYFLPDQETGENPLLRSGIVLAGANDPESNPNDDGYLTALEVTKLDWQGTELAVISGCESGKGDIQSGEGVYGLKRAIAVAGARSSLLSLWKVDDRATAAFMTSFYKKLKDGEGRADALAATQKEFISHPIPGWRHPYVWAAFQLSGDWRPIKW